MKVLGWAAAAEAGLSAGRSTFAVDGKDCRVNEDVARVLKEFHGAGKPIGYVQLWAGRGQGLWHRAWGLGPAVCCI